MRIHITEIEKLISPYPRNFEEVVVRKVAALGCRGGSKVTVFDSPDLRSTVVDIDAWQPPEFCPGI